MGWKASALEVARRTGALGALGAYYGRRRLTALAYHRVADATADGSARLPGQRQRFAGGLRQATRLAGRSDSPSSPWIGCWRGSMATTDLPPRPAVITFDDGYADNLEVAAPLLAERGIPATLFLTTGPTDGGPALFWDQVAWIFATATVTMPTCPWWGSAPGRISPNAIGWSTRWSTPPSGYRPRREKTLLHQMQAAVDSSASDRIPGLYLDWDGVRALDGWTIGAHTVTHPVLTSVPLDVATDEIATSARRIREETGRRCVPSPIPTASKATTTRSVASRAASAGIDLAFTLQPGPARSREVRSRSPGGAQGLRQFRRFVLRCSVARRWEPAGLWEVADDCRHARRGRRSRRFNEAIEASGPFLVRAGIAAAPRPQYRDARLVDPLPGDGASASIARSTSWSRSRCGMKPPTWPPPWLQARRSPREPSTRSCARIEAMVAASGDPGLAAVRRVAYVEEINAVVTERLECSPCGGCGAAAGSRPVAPWDGGSGDSMTRSAAPPDASFQPAWSPKTSKHWSNGPPGRGQDLQDAIARIRLAVPTRSTGRRFRIAITHGDLGPSNVLVTPDGRVAVIDPNLVRAPVEADLAKLAVALRTPRRRLLGGFALGRRLHPVEAAVLEGYGEVSRRDLRTLSPHRGTASRWLDVEEAGYRRVATPRPADGPPGLRCRGG